MRKIPATGEKLPPPFPHPKRWEWSLPVNEAAVVSGEKKFTTKRQEHVNHFPMIKRLMSFCWLSLAKQKKERRERQEWDMRVKVGKHGFCLQQAFTICKPARRCRRTCCQRKDHSLEEVRAKNDPPLIRGQKLYRLRKWISPLLLMWPGPVVHAFAGEISDLPHDYYSFLLFSLKRRSLLSLNWVAFLLFSHIVYCKIIASAFAALCNRVWSPAGAKNWEADERNTSDTRVREGVSPTKGRRRGKNVWKISQKSEEAKEEKDLPKHSVRECPMWS